MIIFTIITFMLIFGIIVALIRNHLVWIFRKRLLDKVFSFDDYEWRINIFLSVEYYTMFYKFWKPLKAEYFYEDVAFLV